MLKRCALLAIFITGCLDRPIAPTSPKTSNVFVGQLTQNSVDKIDLLFMVDNSTSMADKQEILQSAVPVLVKRLTSPICVDAVTGAPTGENSNAGLCQRGMPEFDAIGDIHVGIVTSSLGSHGGSGVCTSTAGGATPNDRAHLLGTARPAGSNADPRRVFDVARTWNKAGFLAWDVAGRDHPPGIADPEVFKATFQDLIAASGEQGCGYEASLESWYRFLVDPEPPSNVTRSASKRTVRGSALLTNPDGTTICSGCDMELLAQRKAFLRPDSLLAIVMLSDENDCSIRDDGDGWFVASSIDGRDAVRMPRATAVCAKNPNDPCCRSCIQDEALPPAGCAPLRDDAVCGATPFWDDVGDPVGLRCFAQSRRFGFDLLYPVERYVKALTERALTLESDGKTQVTNPIYAASPGVSARDPSQVFLAGIVGVPWQDIADDASLRGPGLNYLSAKELLAKGRWAALLGEPAQSPPVLPSDPFMIESIEPRAGINPISHDAIVPASSTSPTASPINGHEHQLSVDPGDADLQFACTFPLTTPRQCSPKDDNCDCADPGAENSPLCQPPTGGPATTRQSYAKAYPGTRHLAVLKGLSEQGIVASICPKLTVSANPDSDPSYGYNPAVAAIIDRLKSALKGKCLPRAVRADPDTHQVLCKVVEAQPAGCDCDAAGRGRAEPQVMPAVLRELEAGGHCGKAGLPACSSFCACEILQETSEAANACRLGQPPPAGSPPGYCYIDDPSSALVARCPDNQKRKLQFVSTAGQPTPANGAITFIACLGAPLATPQSVADAGE